MPSHRTQVLASVVTRLALGAYPLVFVLAFGWAYGKQAFDVAAAASNWANYLNVLLLSGFVLVPPAVARLRTPERSSDALQLLRDHIALERGLVLVGAIVAVALWLSIGRTFPSLAEQSGSTLATWYTLFAFLALAQVPMTLWLGVAQAAGHYLAALVWIVAPRAIALIALAAGATQGVSATVMIATSVAIVVTGQWALARAARQALQEIDPAALATRGNARRVLVQNLSAGAIGLVGTLVTIVPVTLVGRLLPEEVGHAHVIVTLSNAVGAVIVAAFFPLSLTLAIRAREPDGLWRHCLRVARLSGLAVFALIAVGWLIYPACAWLSDRCTTNVFAVASLVVLGAGLRLAALGVYHAAVFQGRPHISLLSATVEGVAVVLVTGLLLESWMLFALGAGFVVGGGLRLLVALGCEARALARPSS